MGHCLSRHKAGPAVIEPNPLDGPELPTSKAGTASRFPACHIL